MQTDQEFSAILNLPQFPGPVLVTRRQASTNSEQGTQQTIALMRAAIVAAHNNPAVCRWAWIWTIPAGSTRMDRACAVALAISRSVHFENDENSLRALIGLDDELDFLISPEALLTMGNPREDCDGFTMLLCACLLCLGIPCEIVTIKADPDRPAQWSHVYCQAFLEDGSPLILDASQMAQRGVPPGWEAPEYFRRKTWGVMYPPERSGLHGYAGLGMPGDFGGEVGPAIEVPQIDTVPIPTTTSGVSAPSGFDLNGFIRQLTAGGLQIARMQATPVGYVQTPGMIANYGPGVNPALGLSLSNPLGGISTSTLLLIGGLGLAIFAFSGRK